MAESGQFYDAQAAIKKHDQEAYDILLKNAENKRDGYLKKAEEEVKDVYKRQDLAWPRGHMNTAFRLGVPFTLAAAALWNGALDVYKRQ